MRAGTKTQAADESSSAACVQRFGRGLLLFLVAAAAGEDATVGHRNLGLADAIVIGLLGAHSADLNFVTNLKGIGSPSLSVEGIGWTAFNGIDNCLSRFILCFDIHVNVRVHPVYA